MCPPGTDQTTRTAQRWNLIAPRRREIEHLDGGNPPHQSGLRFPDPNTTTPTWDAWLLLAKPDLMPVSRLPAEPRAQDCQILNAPLELLDMIVAELPDGDLLALACTCASMLDLAVRHIRRRIQSRAGAWVGQEIACTGTYLQDLPANFLKDDLAYQSVGMPAPLPNEQGRRRFPHHGMAPARSMNWRALSMYDQAAKLDREAWLKELSIRTEAEGESSVARTIIEQTLSLQNLYRQDRSWVLRNLDTKEFVRCYTGKDCRGYVEASGDSAQPLKLDYALLCRISWTDSDGREYKFNQVQRGVWAGHRFEIVSLDSISPSEASGWTDVTAKFVKECGLVGSLIQAYDM